MTEIIRDTPMVSRQCCPTCEPEADPSTEILEIVYCTEHPLDRHGLDDAAMPAYSSYLSGNGEAGGDENRRWCDLLREGRP